MFLTITKENLFMKKIIGIMGDYLMKFILRMGRKKVWKIFILKMEDWTR